MNTSYNIFYVGRASDQREICIIFWVPKKILHFQRSHFQCIFNNFDFLIVFTPNVMSGSYSMFYAGGAWPEEKIYTFGKDPDQIVNTKSPEFLENCSGGGLCFKSAFSCYLNQLQFFSPGNASVFRPMNDIIYLHVYFQICQRFNWLIIIHL